jgi:transcriptional regulator NrdR family protein
MTSIVEVLRRIGPGKVRDTFDEEQVKKIILESTKSHKVTPKELERLVGLVKTVWSNAKNAPDLS